MPPSSSSSSPSLSLFSNKKKRAVVFSLGCSCKDSKSVSVSSPSPALAAATSDRAATHILRCRHPTEPPESSSVDTPTLTSTSTSPSQLNTHNEDGRSFSGLLRQLSQLEQNVMAWDSRRHVDPLQRDDAYSLFPSRDGNGIGVNKREGGGAFRKVGESVAVVKDSADPVADFQRSMLQMIVEKEIDDGEELQELLDRFLALNSPRHHGLIVRAFSGIWDDILSSSGY